MAIPKYDYVPSRDERAIGNGIWFSLRWRGEFIASAVGSSNKFPVALSDKLSAITRLFIRTYLVFISLHQRERVRHLRFDWWVLRFLYCLPFLYYKKKPQSYFYSVSGWSVLISSHKFFNKNCRQAVLRRLCINCQLAVKHVRTSEENPWKVKSDGLIVNLRSGPAL